MVRLAHLSDIHITSPRLDWGLKDVFSKRFTSWINYQVLGRKRRFAFAQQVLTRLVEDLHHRHIDHVIFSGDATALGFESEFRLAAQLLRCQEPSLPGLAVPGNHDYLNKYAEKSGLFEKYFAKWQQGIRVDHHTYPFAQRVGPVWLIGVNGSTANRIPWDASGAVGHAQRERLKKLFDRLGDGPRILVTHYPMCLRSKRAEIKFRNLRDLRHVQELAEEANVSLWLHGHRHHPYHFQTVKGVSFPVICSGTATQTRIWSYNEYVIDGARLKALQRIYDRSQQRFVDAGRFEIQLRV